VATTKKLVESGALDPDAETVLLITGDGLKTLDAVAGQVGPSATVPSTSKAVREALAERGL
jgi:threonine synthase